MNTLKMSRDTVRRDGGPATEGCEEATDQGSLEGRGKPPGPSGYCSCGRIALEGCESCCVRCHAGLTEPPDNLPHTYGCEIRERQR